jgi:hypothetical protein
MRLVVVVCLAFLAWPASALALPGDAAFGPIDPPDGAAVSVDPNGIRVTYTCPVYRVADPGFPLFGGPKDYGVTLSTSPALGADGRLADGVRITGSADPSVGTRRLLGVPGRRRAAAAHPGDAGDVLLAGPPDLHRVPGRLRGGAGADADAALAGEAGGAHRWASVRRVSVLRVADAERGARRDGGRRRAAGGRRLEASGERGGAAGCRRGGGDPAAGRSPAARGRDDRIAADRRRCRTGHRAARRALADGRATTARTAAAWSGRGRCGYGSSGTGGACAPSRRSCRCSARA